jgi:ATP-dependent RNA helicase DeaD
MLKEKMSVPESPIAQERDYSASHEESIERNKAKKKFVTDPNNQRFFINVGYEDGANDESLKAFISKNAPGVSVSDFADVYLKGTFSFFELAKSKADAVISGVEGTSFMGKSVHVEKSERPTDDGSAKAKKFGASKSYHHEGYSHQGYGHRDSSSGDYRHSSGHGYDHHGSSHGYSHDDHRSSRGGFGKKKY